MYKQTHVWGRLPIADAAFGEIEGQGWLGMPERHTIAGDDGEFEGSGGTGVVGEGMGTCDGLEWWCYWVLCDMPLKKAQEDTQVAG